MADFLYNGVPLPEMPEVEGYPHKYAYYQKYDSYRYEIIYGAEPITAITDVGGYGACVLVDRSNGRKLYYLSSTDGTWHETDVYYDINYKGDMGFQWTSHDILYEDGTGVYLAKSPDPVPVDPVPVPDPVQLNPAALMQGFFGMLGVRRSRK